MNIDWITFLLDEVIKNGHQVTLHKELYVHIQAEHAGQDDKWNSQLL